jgi:hypothetical protein
MKRLLLAMSLIFAATVNVSAQPGSFSAQSGDPQYKAVLGSHLFYFYDGACKPGSLNSEAKKLLELIADNSSSELISRARADIEKAMKKFGDKYCPLLDVLLKDTLDSLNTKAKLPGAEQLFKDDLKRLLPSQGPNWRAMTMDECAATIDAELAKHNQELSKHEMFKACDSLTKGFAVQMMTRPRQGTAAGDRVNECMRKYYARTPMSYQQPEKVIEVMCQRPGGL